MKPLAPQTIVQLQAVADLPDFSGTRYEELTHLADGGMGRVYRAEDRALGRPVAIKVLRAWQADAEAARRMLREARVIAGLEHPGIVPVHDVGTLPDGRVYYVMKLVQGRRLDAYCWEERDRAARLRVFERICETVAFAHARGVVHRDLKPQNVMVGAFGEVLVLDWGIAKMLGAAAPRAAGGSDAPGVDRADGAADTRTCLTADGAVIGTPGYMAPEQARGALDAIDERTDVFALGAVLYYLLTERPPLDRAAVAAMQRGTAWCVERPSRLVADLPAPLEAVCLAALASDPAARYPGAAALAADVSRVRAGQLPSVYHEAWTERVRRVLWAYRTPIGLVLAYLLMRCALIFWRTG